MRNDLVRDLADCTEFRQTLQARPPGIVHGTLVLLVVLILQNTQEVEVSFLWWEGTPPLAAALLIAAAGGILLTAIAGWLRILQLRRRVKRR